MSLTRSGLAGPAHRNTQSGMLLFHSFMNALWILMVQDFQLRGRATKLVSLKPGSHKTDTKQRRGKITPDALRCGERRWSKLTRYVK